MRKTEPWGPDEEEEYQERAAILEYDAGMARAEAEHTALWMVSKRTGKVPPTIASRNRREIRQGALKWT